MLNITKKLEGGVLDVALDGRLDTNTAPEFQQEIEPMLGSISELKLDCEKLDYISSAGLRVLLATQKVMAKQGTMKLCHVNETIMEIFEVTGFTDILTIE